MHLFQFLTAHKLRKVPEITPMFWIMKLLTTAMGEALSDFLVFHTNAYVAVAGGFIFFCIALLIQFKAPKYISWIYWFAAGMVAVFGTMAADIIHVVLHVPYIVSSIAFLILLLLVFFIWYKTEHSLSIHSITSYRREVFYWSVVITTFALGTALGDLTAATFGLGYFISILLFFCLICIPAIIYLTWRVYEIGMFWIAYILTRPLGASLADWFGKSKIAGGLGIGSNVVSVVLGACILVFLLYISFSKKERQNES